MGFLRFQAVCGTGMAFASIQISVGFSMGNPISPYKKYGVFEPKKKSMGFLSIGFRRSRKKIWGFSAKPKKIWGFAAARKKIWGFQIDVSYVFRLET